MFSTRVRFLANWNWQEGFKEVHLCTIINKNAIWSLLLNTGNADMQWFTVPNCMMEFWTTSCFQFWQHMMMMQQKWQQTLCINTDVSRRWDVNMDVFNCTILRSADCDNKGNIEGNGFIVVEHGSRREFLFCEKWLICLKKHCHFWTNRQIHILILSPMWHGFFSDTKFVKWTSCFVIIFCRLFVCLSVLCTLLKVADLLNSWKTILIIKVEVWNS